MINNEVKDVERGHSMRGLGQHANGFAGYIHKWEAKRGL